MRITTGFNILMFFIRQNIIFSAIIQAKRMIKKTSSQFWENWDAPVFTNIIITIRDGRITLCLVG